MDDGAFIADENLIDDEGLLVVPEGMTEMRPCYLEGNRLLKQVIFPDGLKAIGPRAFSCCLNLREADFPDSLTFIGEHAFSSCGLRQLVIPTGVTRISSNAFSSCAYLTNITLLEGVERIESQAFANCGSSDMAIKVDLPDSVTFIADDAFLRELSSPAMKPVYVCAPSDSFAHQWVAEHESTVLRAWV